MGRIYECYCHRCKNSNARSDGLCNGKDLFQCKDRGFCWVEITRVKELNTEGTTEKIWKEAMSEAYEKHT